MSKNLTDVDLFADPIEVPTDGDALTGANLEVPWQGLSNRTRNLKNRLDQYETLVSRTRIIGLLNGLPDSAGTPNILAGVAVETNSDYVVPLDFLETGDEIVSVEVVINPADLTRISLRTITHNFSGPLAPTFAIDATIDTFGTGLQKVTITPGSAVVVDRDAKTYQLYFFVDVNATTSSEDSIYGAKITYNTKRLVF